MIGRREMIGMLAGAAAGAALVPRVLAQSPYEWLGPARAADNIVSLRHGIAINTQSLQFLAKKQKSKSIAKLAGWGITSGPAVDVLEGIRDVDWGQAADQAYDEALACLGGAGEPPSQVVLQPTAWWDQARGVWATGETFIGTGVIWCVGLYVSEAASHQQQWAWQPSVGGAGSLLLWEMVNWLWFRFHGGTSEYHPC